MGADARVLIAGDKSEVTQASPTLYDQALYRTARAGRTIHQRIEAAPGLYTMHLKFAELWLAEPGQRSMDISINGRLWWKDWDPAMAAGCVGRAAELRAEAVSPGSTGWIEVELRATGKNDAILQGLEID